MLQFKLLPCKISVTIVARVIGDYSLPDGTPFFKHEGGRYVMGVDGKDLKSAAILRAQQLSLIADQRSREGEDMEQEMQVLFRHLSDFIPSTTAGVFGLYRYPAKFIPQVVSFIMERYSRPHIWVLDPFAGSGTTGLVARLYGCHYEMWDLNPLLEVLHQVATMKPPKVHVEDLVRQMASYSNQWLPEWRNLTYWYPEKVLPLLGRLWGYYHALDDSPVKCLIVVPLLKVSRLFSYNDLQRQKLSRSPRATQRVETLMAGGWQERLLSLLADEIYKVLGKLQEYQNMMVQRNMDGKQVKAIIKAGVDTVTLSHQTQEHRWDFLITSPPYLQAHEYIRCVKLDLFWLGYSEEEIRAIAKLELPYRSIPTVPIYSETFERWRSQIDEPSLLRLYDNYFYGVLGALTALSEQIRQRMFIFVGRASIRSQPVPIDRIFTEHFTALGWKHEATLIDKIVARTLFKAEVNPATGLQDHRMAAEHLVILCRRGKYGE